MPTLRAAALAAVLTLAALPAAARAAVVGYDTGPTLTYSAGAGEANQLAITRAGDRIVFTEHGGLPIGEVADDCTGGGTNVVSCAIAGALPSQPVAGVFVALGDADDTLRVGALGSIAIDGADGSGGTDRLDASAATGYVKLTGGDGDDRLLAGEGESDLSGDAGADRLNGGTAGAQTTYFAGAFPDGPDVIEGGAGLDVVDYGMRAEPLRLTADGVADDGQAGEGDDVAAVVEGIQGGAGSDVIGGSHVVDAELSGQGGDDQLAGGAGDDVLFGGDGDDTLTGNGGDDVAAAGEDGGTAIVGGPADAGADTFAGGAGFDTMEYSSRLASVTATLDARPNDGETGEGDNVGADVEALRGGRGADVLTGNSGAQRITGGSGADTIDPGAGVDEVRAGDGNDTVRAQDGAIDTIACGLGADTLAGDALDELDACEAVTLGPRPPRADTRKPRVRIGGLPARPRFRQVKRGLRPRIGANEPAAFVVELLGSATRARIAARRPFNLTLARRTIGLTAEARRVRLRPKAALLGPRRKLRLRIRVTATDAAGNVRVAARNLKVRR